jgi:NADH:ubiquinone oxidoreductase subunit H
VAICNFRVIFINLNMLYFPTLISVLEVLAVTVPVLLTVAFVTVAERKTMASMQRRLGPNAVG